MRADPRMRICPAAHTHAPLRIYAHVRARTHVYAHAKEFFWHQICSTALSNRVPSSVRHHSFILSNRCIIRIHIDATLAAQSVQTVIICHSFSTNLPFIITHLHQSPNYLPFIQSSIHSPLTYLLFISNFLISLHYLARIIFHLYPISIPTNRPSYQYVSLL